MCSATTADTVTATVTWTDPVNSTGQPRTVINAAGIGTNAQTNGVVFMRASAAAISAQLTVSSQATTKCSAWIQRMN